jgi:large subunit ribosomal protein L29
MKRAEYLKEIKNLTVNELKEKARGLAEELMKLRFRKGGGQLEQTHRLRELKKNVARVKTAMVGRARAEADAAAAHKSGGTTEA